MPIVIVLEMDERNIQKMQDLMEATQILERKSRTDKHAPKNKK